GMLEQANAREDKISIRLIDPPADGAELEHLEPGESVTRIVSDARGLPVRRTWVPVTVDRARAGVLEISESLDAEQRYVHKTLLPPRLPTPLLVGMCAVLSAGLGAWLVGKPMQSLADKARRVGRGDFSGPLVLRQRDEIGQLAAEMNAMCERLVEA